MSQLTVRSVDDDLRARLEREAQERGLSLNRTLLAVLREALGLAPRTRGSEPVEHHDLDDLAGTWTTEEAEEFDETLREQRQVDEKLWR